MRELCLITKLMRIVLTWDQKKAMLAMLREMGSQWEQIPGTLRYAMLQLANRLAKMIERMK